MTKILVHNYVKEYPDYFKIIEYSNPHFVGSSDELVDEFKYYDLLDPNTYYSNLPKSLKSLRLFFYPTPETKKPVINQSFDFYNDKRAEMLWEVYKQQKRVDTQKINKNSIESSIRRSRRIIKDLIYCNQFNMWVTFTFKNQIFDIDIAKKRISQWLKDQQKQYGSFDYLIVPEYHKSGAVHFHALLNNYNGVVLPAISKNTGKQIIKKGRKIYNIQSYNRGFTQLEYITSSLAVSRYIAKYITKYSPVMSGRKRFFHSKGLKKPVCTPNSYLADHNAKTLFFTNDLFKISYLPKEIIKNNFTIDIPF